MKVDHYKKELLYRKAQGKKRLNKFESKKENLISNAKNCATQLNLEETDKLIRTIGTTHWSSSTNEAFPSTADFFNYIENKLLQQECHILIDDDWKYCGAILAKDNCELNRKFNFDENESDEIRFISVDLSTFASIDYIHNHYPPYYEYLIKWR
ncbi:hypothetical protein V0R52_07350 [Pseudomonas asiatica]|uniref:hypothetical protein n=1 Tax=Pseudomonas TaxID=286 RepID=UPI0005C6AFF3|nr:MULTISPECIES: hypothetical protein [Pseudomonas]MEE1916210.1 hypothetical protein [Pseudomonas asiatica]WOB56883.1 hypothetical protein NY023_16750 [Pseudomonas sp. NBB]